ncbi:MAG: WD40 repeat domain-containing protein [Gammaproteobacteria bacterium]|jgi:hypothetical protein
MRTLVITLYVLVLAACSSGGGGGTPVPAAPVFYATSTGVFVVDSDGNNRIQLTPDASSGDQYFGFALSPDRQWVAVLAALNGETRRELYLVSAGGEHFTRVSVFSNAFSSINGILDEDAWSPGSNALVYLSDDTYENRDEIFAVSINSDNTFTAPQKINGVIGAASNVYVRDPAWSYDGSHVAYRVLDGIDSIGVNTHEFGTTDGDLNFSVRVSKPRFTGTAEVGRLFAWSPVANQLVYQGQVRGADDELFIVGASENEATYVADDRLVSSAGDNAYAPIWSDDGRYIAYRTLATATDPIAWKIFDSAMAIPNALKLVDDQGFFVSLDWVPGSNRISTYHNDGTGNLLTTINPDGSNRQETPIEDIDTNVALSPDGNLITVTETLGPPTQYRMLFIPPADATIQREILFSNSTTDINVSRQNSWSPDSDQFIIERAETNTKLLELVNVGDGTAVTLDTDIDVSYVYQWAPDANKVCAAKVDGAAINDLICMNRDGGGKVTITMDIRSNTDFTF